MISSLLALAQSHILWILLVPFSVLGYVQNMAFTFSSRSRNSGDPEYHRKAAWLSNGIYVMTHLSLLGYVYKALLVAHSLPLMLATGIAYVLSTTEGSVKMMRIMLKEKGKRAVGAAEHIAQIGEEDYRALLERVASLEKRGMGEVAAGAKAVATEANNVATDVSQAPVPKPSQGMQV